MKHHLYRHFNSAGELLYVGVSLCAIGRLSQHRSTSHWFGEIATVTIESFASRTAVLDAERAAIRQESPRHNRTHSLAERIERPQLTVKPTALVRALPSLIATGSYTRDRIARTLRIDEGRVDDLMRMGRLVPFHLAQDDYLVTLDRVLDLMEEFGVPIEWMRIPEEWAADRPRHSTQF